MKKILVLLPVLAAGLGAFCLNLSCSSTPPSSPNNFQTPVVGISNINPTLTYTPTPTFTPTFTITPTSTPSSTPTPYVTATVVPWIGLNAPSAIVVDTLGYVYVADTGNNHVGKYTSNGILVATWGSGGVKGKIAVNGPVGLALDSSNNLYVIGSGTTGVNEYGLAGTLTQQFNTVTFTNPKGLAVDSSGNIYVSDTANNRIVQMTSSGALGSGLGGSGILNLAAPVTSSGTIPVTLSSSIILSGLAFNGGSIYVATQGTGINSSPYSSLLSFDINTGMVTNCIPGFNNPSALTFDSNNNLFVADTGNKQAEEFGVGNFTQVPLVVFNDGGLLQNPKGIAVDSSGNIYVTDSVTNQVIKFVP